MGQAVDPDVEELLAIFDPVRDERPAASPWEPHARGSTRRTPNPYLVVGFCYLCREPIMAHESSDEVVLRGKRSSVMVHRSCLKKE